MEMQFRLAFLSWLSGDPFLSTEINGFTEEAPARASLPWLAIAASASADWSTKTRTGREIRIAIELRGRGDQLDGDAMLLAAIEQRIDAFPPEQGDFTIVTIQFLRSRIEQRVDGGHTTLLEYRFRVLSP